MNKKRTAVIAVILVAAVCGFATYKYFNRDLTGMTWEEISTFQAEHPSVNVSYTVTINGGESPLELDESTTSVKPETIDQLRQLLEQAAYLQAVTLLDLTDLVLPPFDVQAVYSAFPAAQVQTGSIRILDKEYTADAEEIDLSTMTADQTSTVITMLQAAPDALHFGTINLLDQQGKAQVSVDDALMLQEAFPHVHIRYATELFGQTVSTEMETLEYARVEIGDAGVAQIRKLLPMMDKLTYLKLDSCGTTDDTMAKLREDFPNIEVHWRIYFANRDVMTDNYKLWAGGLLDRHTVNLIHLRGIKYLDIGHHNLTNINFCKNLKDLEVGIFAIGPLADISGIKDCTKLEYLELLCNGPLDDEDMKNLEGLVNLEHLNIGNCRKITNLSFTDNMTKLKRFHCTMSNIPQEEIDRFIALHPDCEVNFSKVTDPIEGGWRYNLGGQGILDARYQLLRQQIGYNTQDYSQWPRGELKEEVTYESTGIIPED